MTIKNTTEMKLEIWDQLAKSIGKNTILFGENSANKSVDIQCGAWQVQLDELDFLAFMKRLVQLGQASGMTSLDGFDTDVFYKKMRADKAEKTTENVE
jgi:hypothetical protein